jgi:stress-induced morphogen
VGSGFTPIYQRSAHACIPAHDSRAGDPILRIGFAGGCGSFYAILVSSPAFKGLSTIKQHKLVNEVLKEDIKGIHGLQVGSALGTGYLLFALCSGSDIISFVRSLRGQSGLSISLADEIQLKTIAEE